MSRYRDAPAVGLDAQEIAQRDLVRVLAEVPGAGAVLGAVVVRLDRMAAPVGSSDVLARTQEQFRLGVSRAAGVLEQAAAAAGVPLVAPARPTSTVPEVPDVEMYERKRNPRAAIDRRASQRATRRLRDNIERRSAGNG